MSGIATNIEERPIKPGVNAPKSFDILPPQTGPFYYYMIPLIDVDKSKDGELMIFNNYFILFRTDNDTNIHMHVVQMTNPADAEIGMVVVKDNDFILEKDKPKDKFINILKSRNPSATKVKVISSNIISLKQESAGTESV
jgi:hypothetical protein